MFGCWSASQIQCSEWNPSFMNRKCLVMRISLKQRANPTTAKAFCSTESKWRLHCGEISIREMCFVVWGLLIVVDVLNVMEEPYSPGSDYRWNRSIRTRSITKTLWYGGQNRKSGIQKHYHFIFILFSW